jgi:hypothetical protein
MNPDKGGNPKSEKRLKIKTRAIAKLKFRIPINSKIFFNLRLL